MLRSTLILDKALHKHTHHNHEVALLLNADHKDAFTEDVNKV